MDKQNSKQHEMVALGFTFYLHYHRLVCFIELLRWMFHKNNLILHLNLCPKRFQHTYNVRIMLAHRQSLPVAVASFYSMGLKFCV